MELASEELYTSNPIPDAWKEGDVVEPARYYLCARINERLAGHVKPTLMPFMHMDILMFPDCLLTAMYVLFAMEVSGKTRPAIMCRGCERYFIPEHASQIFCEATCRKRHWWTKKHGKQPTATTGGLGDE